jgi:hypothetical protein
MFCRRIQRLVLMVPLIFGAGCTEAEADLGEEALVSGSIAVLQVERLSDVRADEHGSASLTAAFAHYRGLEGEQVGKL